MSNICVNHNMSVICYDRIAESDNFECVSFLNRLSKKILNNLCAKIFFLTHTHTHLYIYYNINSEDICFVFGNIYKCNAVIARYILFCRQILHLL